VCICVCVCVKCVYVCEVYVGTFVFVFVFVFVCMSGWSDYMLQSINRGSLLYSGLLLLWSTRHTTYKYGVICYTNFMNSIH